MSVLLGSKIRKIRGKRSQTVFGKILGVDRTTIGSWEIGRHEPNLDLLNQIATIGGVSMNWLSSNAPCDSFDDERLHQDPKWRDLVRFASKQKIQPEKIKKLITLSMTLTQTD
ncbi:MAG: helix-turn-helix domain-containing protein [Selenomonadales bacterium]|nr:helix-turn-helix domain-containing protein [Selenomonadales bacterium]